VKSDAFPDLAELYRLFGLQAGVDGKLTIDDGAPHRADRDAIMTGLAHEPSAQSNPQ